MKKNVVYIIFFLMIQSFLFSQTNLVPNPSFETITSCNAGYINAAIPWNTPSNGTPDLYNSCSNMSAMMFGSPNNILGYQYAHSGNGYAGAGFYSFDGPPTALYYVEYIQVKLDTDLVANNKYCASFYLSLANKARQAIKNFGMYFSNSPISQPTYNANLLVTPQIIDTNFVTDTLGWVHFTGGFTASGGERYLIIGNFNDSANTSVIQVNSGSGTVLGAYYYLDDVDVHLYNPVAENCCVCNHVGIEEIGIKDEELGIYPNPASEKITLTINNQQLKTITIYNVLGCEILKQVQNDKSATIDVSSFANGIYFVEVQMDAGVVRKKFVKE